MTMTATKSDALEAAENWPPLLAGCNSFLELTVILSAVRPEPNQQ